jgi:chemotaxis protein MotB
MADQAPVIVIRKKKKGGHAGHHGGAWKVAYADFVTAMMSFFLLLWLLNVTTDVQRKGIADYFAPASLSKSESGAGGVMGGQTITVDGAQISQYTPPAPDQVTVPTVGKGDEGDDDTRGKDENAGTSKTPAKNPVDDAISTASGNSTALNKDEQNMVAAMKQEEGAFDQAAQLLKQAIMATPELRDFANQIVIDRTPEGLRIQIVDRDKFSMFPSGGSVPYERGRDLLRLVGKVIAKLPNKISVTGHTDSNPFSAGSSHDNWSLSSERANTSRTELVAAGVDENRIARVVGLADRDPFVPNDPKDPGNRRISIVLLRQAIPPAEVQDAAAPAPASPTVEVSPANPSVPSAAVSAPVAPAAPAVVPAAAPPPAAVSPTK